MRFLSCHIVGFGKFSDVSFDFAENPFILFKENGFGKTTLTAFLECMLYGMDGGRSKNIADNLRAKYEPFAGGAYGGSLTLSHGGKTYRIERTFGKTAGGDTAKIYDENRMQSYEFGERGETFGESLLGVNRESYRRSVYIPQESVTGYAIPDDLKGKLLAFLSATGQERGLGDAVERLENAERALRAKRRPAKGKLDELEERLSANMQAQTECIRAGECARVLQSQIAEKNIERRQLKTELSAVEKSLEDCAKAEYVTAQERLRADLQAQADEKKGEIETLQKFFYSVSPDSLNVDGLQGAVERFYSLEEEIRLLKTALAETDEKSRRVEELETKLLACRKALQSFELILKEKQTATADKKDEKKRPKKERGAGILCLLSLVAVIFGIWKKNSLPIVGWLCIFLGGVIGFSALLGVLKNARIKRLEKSAPPAFANEELDREYRATQEEEKTLRSQLALLQTDKAEYDKNKGALQEKLAEQSAVEKGIKNFLAHFPFGEIYDYRFAVATIEEKIARYEKAQGEYDAVRARMEKLPPSPVDGFALTADDMPRLRSEKTRLQGVDERLSREIAELTARLKGQETIAYALGDYKAEETQLTEEKERLEKRYLAIRTAKELLLRARANMASRYLEPVEKQTRFYLRETGFPLGETLRFTGEGEPLLEEKGGFRQMDYYSAGLKSLVDFCVRIALFERALPNECPLILDDPFERLDDEKCAYAKTLVKKLAQNRQVLYFTCKKERTL